MTKRIVVDDKVIHRPTFARTLFDGALPVDMVIGGSLAAVERPRILSQRGDEEDNLQSE